MNLYYNEKTGKLRYDSLPINEDWQLLAQKVGKYLIAAIIDELDNVPEQHIPLSLELVKVRFRLLKKGYEFGRQSILSKFEDV